MLLVMLTIWLLIFMLGNKNFTFLGKGVQVAGDGKGKPGSSSSGQRLYGLDFDDWTSRNKTKQKLEKNTKEESYSKRRHSPDRPRRR